MHRFTIFFLAALSLLALSCGGAQYDYPFQNPGLSVERRVENLLDLLTVEEKLTLLTSTQSAVDRLGLPGFSLGGEACHGVAADGFTVFPQCIGLAATFDLPQQLEIYSAVSDEARARWNTTGESLCFWTPNINIVRDPRWGRGQETYGEDPYLMGEFGKAVVRGLQGDDPRYVKTSACAKHFSVHSGPEPLRHRYNPSVSDRDLWDTYMYAFRELVEAGVEQVMCAYTRFEGKPCCGSSRLLQDILREKWGFKGIVVSDCGAIGDFYEQNHHETHADGADAASSAVLAGTNIECGAFGGTNVYANLARSLEEGSVTEADIDAVLGPALALRVRLGAFDPAEMLPWKDLGKETISSEEHHALALKAARESVILLANDGILPLDKSLKKILVVGPNADDAEMQLGNYNGKPTPEHTLSIVDAIRAAAPSTEIVYARGCGHADNEGCKFLLETDGNTGIKCEYFANADFGGSPVETHNSGYLKLNMKDECPAYLKDLPAFSARFTAHVINTDGTVMHYVIRGNGRFRMIVDGKVVCEQKQPNLGIKWDSVPDMDQTFTVKPGQDFDLVIEYVKDFDDPANFYFDMASFYSFPYEKVRVPADADAVVFVAGLSSRLENEQLAATCDGFYGGDRTKVELPAVQQKMLRGLHASGKPVVVVNCSGSAVSYAEVEDQCNALLQAFYAGQAMGTAVADVLFGNYNPAGRLPVTVYASTSQIPDFLDYNMEGRTYRYFREEPEFAFGYGLSYTTFSYGRPVLSASSAKAGESVDVSVDVTNTDRMAGDEVVQVYVKCLDNPLAPIKALKGFSRVNILPGQTATVKITLDPRAFETFDFDSSDMAVLKGRYQILCGSSSRDEDLQAVDFEIL